VSELREDLTTRDWAVFATERARRPDDFRKQKSIDVARDREADCPFCPGNEDRTPAETMRLRLAGTAVHAWDVRVVPNRFAALAPAGRPQRTLHDGHFRSMPGTGMHEVIVEMRDHARRMPDMADDEVTLVFDAYQQRYRALRDLPGVQMIVPFRNYGEEAGTSLVHPHSQIIASPVETPVARRKYQVAREHYQETGTCLYCDLRDWECSAAKRVLFETGHFTVIHPYASRWPFETWILPLRHTPSFGAASRPQLEDAALATRRCLRLLRDALGDPPFNYVVHTAPVADEDRPYFLWHIQIIPRLTIAAGFEMGSGMYINVALPEETASFLRELERDARS
jgi:UDPglucose--hexose-1-phosphate uridylyltransferase